MPVWIFWLIYILAIICAVLCVLLIVSCLIVAKRADEMAERQIEQVLAIANKEGENETDNQW